MSKVRILNRTSAPIVLSSRNNAGALVTAMIPARNGILPGEAEVDKSLLDSLKGNKVVQAYFASGSLREARSMVNTDDLAKQAMQQQAAESAQQAAETGAQAPQAAPVAPTPVPIVPAAPVAPAAAEAPEAPATSDNEVPEVTIDTPADAPWAK